MTNGDDSRAGSSAVGEASAKQPGPVLAPPPDAAQPKCAEKATDPNAKLLVEHGLGAIRYNEIYKAVWQNFSYMTLVSGAILAFGKDTLGTSPAALFACLPLLIWYWATFEPLNKYGDAVEKRLAELEAELGFNLYKLLYDDRKLRAPLWYWLIPMVLVPVSAVLGYRFAVRPVTMLTFVAVPVLLLLLWLWKVQKLTVRFGMRVCAIILHGVIAYLLAQTLQDGPLAGQKGTVRIDMKLEGTASSVGTDAAQLLRRLSDQPPPRIIATPEPPAPSGSVSPRPHISPTPSSTPRRSRP